MSQSTLEAPCSESFFEEKKNILSRILQAAKTIPPVWPLKNSIACNPLLHMEEQNFWQALNAIRLESARFSTTSALNRLVNGHMIKWLQSYLDTGVSKMQMPKQKEGFYATWKDLVRFDADLIKGDKEKTILSSMPASPTDAVEWSLELMHIEGDEIDNFLREQLTSLRGWAGYIRWHTEWNESRSKPDISLAQYMAVRLGTYLIASKQTKLQEELSQETTALQKEISIDAIIKNEQIFAENFLRKILSKARTINKGNTIAAQWIFCIDVRSEPFRHQLEQTGNYETYGFAGFFGLPVAVASKGCGTYSSCPVLLKPKWEMGLSKRGNNIAQKSHELLQKLANQTYSKLKYNFGSPFALAETMGIWAGAFMVVKSFQSYFLSSRKKDPRARKLNSLDLEANIPFKEQVAIAESALTTMDLTAFSPVVVICGHGSSTQNNPFASSLDCGACGGNHGGPNARLLASILNSEAVRQALFHKGLNIPSSTVFVAAQHDTTTDEILFFEEQGEIQGLEQIKEDAAAATLANRLRRSHCFEKDSPPSGKGPVRRSLDWSEVRPEWGLAKNGAFLVGPRDLSRSLDLEGRSFLHSYNWEKDLDGSKLEGILTAPMVVAQWINTQYFFSTVDPYLFGSGSKITHNIVGKVGVMQGNGSDLMHGLPLQSLFLSDTRAYHEPIRLLTVIFAPVKLIDKVIDRQEILQKLFCNEWVNLVAIDPIDFIAYRMDSTRKWSRFDM